MKKIFTIIYLLCMVSTFSYAQNFRYGFTGGVNLSKPMGDIEPQCQAGLLLGAKGELGIPSVIKGFIPIFITKNVTFSVKLFSVSIRFFLAPQCYSCIWTYIGEK